jgi:hypothetical protein
MNTDEQAEGATSCAFICIVLLLLTGFAILASFVFRYPMGDVEPGAMEHAEQQ